MAMNASANQFRGFQ